jgi:predicted nucleic-acid-binding protein
MPAAGIDTNVFLRVFIDDDGPQHAGAVALVRTQGQVFVGTVVIVEAVWALRSLFKFPKEKLVNFINTVLEADAFVLENREVLERAMFAFAVGKAGFADYVIVETARHRGIGQVFTFDRALARAEGAAMLKVSNR